MGATVGSDNLPTEVWGHQNGTFQVVVGIALGQMADLEMIPGIALEMREQIGDVLHERWPDKFPSAAPGPILILTVSDYPVTEQVEFARAVGETARALRAGDLPERVRRLYHLDHVLVLGERADELARFCRRSMDAPPRSDP